MSSLPGPAPPNTVPVLLVGGPCNGMLRNVSVGTANSGSITCQGARYVPDPRDENYPPKEPYTVERWVPNWQAATIFSGQPPKPVKNVSGAWSLMMRAFAHGGTHQIRRMRNATARLDRLAYKHRRG